MNMERKRVRHSGISGRPYSKYYDVTKWSETEGNTTWRRILNAAHVLCTIVCHETPLVPVVDVIQQDPDAGFGPSLGKGINWGKETG